MLLIVLGVGTLVSIAPAGPSGSGRAVGLAPVTSRRAVGLVPITSGRAAVLKPITNGRAAGLKPITSGRAAGLKPITSGRAAGLKPIISGRAVGLKPIISGRAAGLAPISSGRAAGLNPILTDRATSPDPVESGPSTSPELEGASSASTLLKLLPRGSLPEGYVQEVARSRFPLVAGDVALRKGEYAKAAVAFADAVRRHPDAAGPCFALGDAFVGIGQFDRAARTIRTGLSSAPRWADSLDRRRVYGVADDHAKHLKSAEDHARETPENANAWFLLGYLRMTSGLKQERDLASRAFHCALSLDPDDDLSLRFLRRLR